MTRREEDTLAGVPEGAKQARETQWRWNWVEPSVWTDRMLAALEHGVKGGKWFSLIDKVYSLDNLYAAADKVHSNKGAPGVDHVTVEKDSTTSAGQTPTLLSRGSSLSS
jgi:RNA-directed DNA polymerase